MTSKLVKTICAVGALLGSLLAGVNPTQAGTLQATVNWSNPDMTNGIRLEKAAVATGPFTLLALLGATSSVYNDATNAPGDKVCYRLAYYNAVGTGTFSAPACSTFPTNPTGIPGSVTVTIVSIP